MQIEIKDDLIEKLTSHGEAKDRELSELISGAIELYLEHLDDQYQNRMRDIELDSLAAEVRNQKRPLDMVEDDEDTTALYNSLVRQGLWRKIQAAA